MSTTPNMQLTLPEVLVTSGPQYATQINSALDVVDAHDHSTGKGVRITPSGLNINADLSFGNNQATGLKAVVLQAQSAVASLGALYNIGGNLFYRDGGNNAIQLTSGGTLNVSSVGAITGLTSPASASFVSLNSSFVFQSDATTYGKLEIGDVLIYSRSAAVGTAQAVTLVADPSTSAYSLRLPVSAPADNTLMRMKSGVNVSQFVTLLGTTNQVSVAHNTSDITLSLPQNIHTGATPTFAGLTLTGALGGTSATLSGAFQAASATITGNVSLTGALGSTISAPNYALSLNGLTVNTIGATIGSEVFVQADLAVQNILKTNTIAVRTGSLVTFSNGITMPFLPISAGAISGTTVTGTTSMATPSINVGSGATIINALGATINSLTCSTINSPTGTEIQGRTSTTPYPAFTVGQIVVGTMGSNLASSSSYQNIISLSLTAGVWEVSANVMFLWNGFDQSAMKMRKLETAISLSSAAVDDAKYRSVQHFPLLGDIVSGEFVQMPILSRRIQIGTTTTVYLVGISQADSGGLPNNCQYNTAGTIIKAQRVA